MNVVIMAGGKGTRISGLDSSVPKPMLKIAGKPVLEWQIECLKRQGYKNITVSIGHMGDIITDYFGDELNYIIEDEPLGTAGALYHLKDKIDDDFILINGDIVFDTDIARFVDAHRANVKNYKALATILTHPNDHPFDSGIVETDSRGCVIKWLNKEDERRCFKNRTNAGLHMLSPLIMHKIARLQKLDLDRDILKPLVTEKLIFAYDTPEYVKDMGTPERFNETEKDILSGMVASKNLSKRQKCVFIDRDGTINEYVGFLRSIDDFRLIDGVAEAIRRINRSGYLAIIVTNQPVIARGEVTWQLLTEIHNKMETLLGEQGAYVDDIFICPHHPDSGFAGEVMEYKVECECRKPNPGMLLDASLKYNIDLSESYMIGDSKTDEKVTIAAGCKGYYKSLIDFCHVL